MAIIDICRIAGCLEVSEKVEIKHIYSYDETRPHPIEVGGEVGMPSAGESMHKASKRLVWVVGYLLPCHGGEVDELDCFDGKVIHINAHHSAELAPPLKVPAGVAIGVRNHDPILAVSKPTHKALQILLLMGQIQDMDGLKVIEINLDHLEKGKSKIFRLKKKTTKHAR